MTSQKAKTKLTLSVDEKVVEKAKTLGLNLSEITEKVLRGFAFAPDEVDKASLYDKYKELMDTMLPLLKEYGTSVKVAESRIYDDKGNEMFTESISLCPDNSFYYDMADTVSTDIRSIELYDFLEPKEILSNLVTILATAESKRKERVEEIEVAKRIVLAITESIKKPYSRKNVMQKTTKGTNQNKKK